MTVFTPMQADRIQDVLQELRELVEASPEDLALVDTLMSSMHRLRLSEALDEQISILAYCRGLWDQEEAIAGAMDCIHDLTENQGIVPSPEQEQKLVFLGWKPRPRSMEMPQGLRKFNRKIQ
jgi:hypothetical protein